MKVRLCELCNEKAAVFCPADAAFLCSGCDAKVHGANFLVARHVRRPLHAAREDRPSISIVTSEDDDDESIVDDAVSSSSLSSPCKSSPAEGAAAGSRSHSTTVNDRKKKSQRNWAYSSNNAKGVFVDWCGRLGPAGGGADVAVVVRAASAALEVCTERLTLLPLRVGLAAALWLGLRLGGGRCRSLLQSWKVAKRLEEISGVPARVIVAVGSKLERAARISDRQKRVRRRDLEEGWAESS